MGADGVEIAQRNTPHARVGRAAVAQDVLGHLLGIAVGRGRRQARRPLRHGQHPGLAVDRGRRGKHHVGASEFVHQGAQIHERRQVVAIVLERIGHRFAHGLERREMDRRDEPVFFEDAPQGLPVAGIDLLERHLDARDAPHALDGAGFRIGKVVDDHYAVTGGD